MALSDAQIYNGDGSTRDFTILGEILSESHLRVWIDDVLQSSDDWDLLGNTVLFNDAPDDGANVQFLVSTTGTDFPSNPSAIGDVSININDVITVAANIGIINTVSTNINDAIAVGSNIDNVNDVANNKTNIDAVVNNKTNIDTVATNISKVTTIAEDTLAINEIYNNRLEIYEADNNALIATNKASEASTNAISSQLKAWEAEAEAMTSESYATEAVDVFVKEYTSNGDGTFSSTNTTDYSAFHWSEKSKDSAQGEAVNISYDNSGSDFTSTNVQDVLDEVDVTKMNKNINTLTNKTTPANADEMVIADSVSSFSLKKLSFTNLKAVLKTYFDTLYNNFIANDLRVKTALNASGTAPIYACRAWVNFNGTGTVAIRGSGNVSSITDNGVGDYTVNFTTAMPDINYSLNGTAGVDSEVNVVWGICPRNNIANFATTSIRFNIKTGSTTVTPDSSFVSVSIFR